MARCDGGVGRTIRGISLRVPGKEIWITEWSTFGAGNCSNRVHSMLPILQVSAGDARE